MSPPDRIGGATGVPAGISGDPGPTTEERRRTRRLVSASALMASGTALSRVMGFFRLMLLVYLFGNGTRQAEMFTIATTVPNSMYILLAGGVLNTVLVPQIVRAIRGDADRGEAYTNRIMTAGLIGSGLDHAAADARRAVDHRAVFGCRLEITTSWPRNTSR